MKTIRFTQWYKVKDEIGTEYEEGHTEKFTDASANHFITRGVAVEVADDPKKPAKRTRPKKVDTGADMAATDSGVSGDRSESDKK